MWEKGKWIPQASRVLECVFLLLCWRMLHLRPNIQLIYECSRHTEPKYICTFRKFRKGLTDKGGYIRQEVTFQAFSESIFLQSNRPTAAWNLMTFVAVTQGWDKCAGMAASYVMSLKSPSQHFNLMSSVWSCRTQNKAGANGRAGAKVRNLFYPNVTFEYFSISPMFTFDKLIIIMLISFRVKTHGSICKI